MTVEELEAAFDDVYSAVHRIKHELGYISKQLDDLDSNRSDLVQVEHALESFLYRFYKSKGGSVILLLPR